MKKSLSEKSAYDYAQILINLSNKNFHLLAYIYIENKIYSVKPVRSVEKCWCN